LLNEEENRGYNNPPPSMMGYSDNSYFPMNADAAWILQLIQLKIGKANLPDSIKTKLIDDVTPYIVNASMTKVTRGEVKLFLGEYEELWMKFNIFIHRERYRKELSYLKTYIRGLLMQNYNKSIDGWQGDHVFERKSTERISQEYEDKSDRMRSRFLGRKKKDEQVVMVSGQGIV